MLRVSAVAEAAGVPSASLVCEGFIGQAANTSVGLGMPNLPVSLVPGHVDGQQADELKGNLASVTVDRVIENLTRDPAPASPVNEPSPHDIVFEGDFDEVNRLFYENGWSDGLPIVPPTRERVEAFLAYTDRSPAEELGVLLPDNRRATPWNVAVNGVMAGCRPSYMPILIALAEAMADPRYGVEHSGNTPGAETLIIINGPLIKELEFNFEQGALRDGFQANTSIGRFWRLYLRNVAGFLLHQNDKGTYGNTWRVVLAENESVSRDIGWPSIAEDMGFGPDDNVVTISRFTGGDVLTSAFGNSGERLVPYLADGLAKQHGWQLIFTVGMSTGMLKPLLVLSPVLAKTIAESGMSKAAFREALFANARITAEKFERYIGEYTNLLPGQRTLVDLVNLGKAPEVFAESDDPQRLVPIVASPDDFMIAVAGDPLRTNAYAFAHNGILGFPTSKKIELPNAWNDLPR
ncbi:MAG: UGSC family (seleno)protein [Pseudomonadota bacterium]